MSVSGIFLFLLSFATACANYVVAPFYALLAKPPSVQTANPAPAPPKSSAATSNPTEPYTVDGFLVTPSGQGTQNIQKPGGLVQIFAYSKKIDSITESNGMYTVVTADGSRYLVKITIQIVDPSS